MKKIGVGVAAVILAVSAFTFTEARSNAKFVNYYWFRTQTDGTVINGSSVPPFQSPDPYGCSTGADGCSKAYTGYTMVSPGVYAPSGTLQVTHKKN